MCPMTTYKEFAIIPAAVQEPDGECKVQGAINPAQGEAFGEMFEGQNLYLSKDAQKSILLHSQSATLTEPLHAPTSTRANK
jgi:hypothetical protein